MGKIEPRHATAAIFWSLSVMCVVFAVVKLVNPGTNGIEVILLIGNACLTHFMAMIFNAPEPNFYDTVPIERYPKSRSMKRNFAQSRAPKSAYYRYDPCAARPIEHNHEDIPAD